MIKKILIASLLVTCYGSFAKDLSDVNQEEEDKWDVNNQPGEATFAEITVDEGTWMSLDVSPDGKTLVFDMLGDIYTMPISGGNATNITNSMAWDMQPRFSPDGDRLSYTSDAGGGNNIWTMGVDGSAAQQVTKEDFRLLNNADWSPDGNYLVARKHFTGMRSLGAGEIWMYHTSGGSGIQLNERPNEQKDLGEPVFSYDGKHVLFSRDSTPGKYFEYSKDSNSQIYEIFAIDIYTGEVEPWVSGPGGAVRPTPSPDGKYLAFVRRIREKSALFLQDRVTGAEFPIYQELERDMQETWAIEGVYPNFSWTPDGKSIVFWAAGKIKQIDIETKTAKDIPFAIRDRREMRKVIAIENTAFEQEFDARMLRWVQASPNGQEAIFQSLGHIYRVKLPDGKPKRLTSQNEHFEYYPRYSADGKKVVYTTWHDSKLGDVRLVSAKGGRSKVVSQRPGHYTDVAISPDGKNIAVQAIGGGYLTSDLYSQEQGLYNIDLVSKEQERISKTGSKPFFVGDSSRVFFNEQKTEKEVSTTTLVSTDLKGHKRHEHYSGNWVGDFAISPDQQWLAFTQRYQVYVTPFTQSGKAIDIGPEAKNLPVQRFSKFSGDNLSWSGDSTQLQWSMGPVLYQQNIAQKFNFLAESGTYAAAKSPQSGDHEVMLEPTAIHIKLSVKSDMPDGVVALIGATIISMEGDAVIDDGVVVVEGNRIVAIGPRDTVTIPSGATEFDLAGKTIIPGIVDFHWHGPYSNAQIQPQTNWNALASLAFGVTTTHNPSANTSAVFSASEMQRAGQIIAPRIFSTGTILYGANHSITAEVSNLDDAVDHLQRMKSVGAFSVKSYNQPRREQRQQVMEAARQAGLMVVPEGGSLFQANMSMVIDGHHSIEHALPVANIYQDVTQLMSQSETAYTPTLGVAYGGIWGERYWYDRTDVWKHPLLTQFVAPQFIEPTAVRRYKAPDEDYNHFNVARGAAQLREEGVKVLLGAHGQREGLAAHWEMWMFEQGGMKPLDVLRAATIDGATALGMADELGSLKVGKLADLVVLNANPLENLRDTDKVSMVMINGRLYDSATMHQLAPKKRQRAKLYFEQ